MNNNVITSYFSGVMQKTVTVAPEQTFFTCQDMLQSGAECVGIRRNIEGSVSRFFNVQDGEIWEIADPSLR